MTAVGMDVEYRILRMLRVGGIPNRIAAYLDLSSNVVRRVAIEHRMQEPHRPNSASVERRIIRLLREGASLDEIAIACGVSPWMVKEITWWAYGPGGRTAIVVGRRGGGRRSLDPEIRDEIVRLVRAGVRHRVIAERLGVGTTTVHRVRKESGLAGAPRRILTDEELDAAMRLLEDGASYGEVERTLKISRKALRRRFPGYGWTLEQAIEFQRVLRRLDPDNHETDVFKLAFAHARRRDRRELIRAYGADAVLAFAGAAS